MSYSLMKSVMLWVTFILCAACAATRMTIPAPQWQFRDPDLDFTKVRSLCIFPVSSVGGEESKVTDAINVGVSQAISAQYPDWKVISAIELFQLINRHQLGRGYQNYVADLNTFEGERDTLTFSGETLKFFEDLRGLTKCDALLFNRYKLSTVVEAGDIYRVLSVDPIMYFVPDRQAWWIANVTVRGWAGSRTLSIEVASRLFGKKPEPIESLVDKVVQSIAQNLGKGTLKQL